MGQGGRRAQAPGFCYIAERKDMDERGEECVLTVYTILNYIASKSLRCVVNLGQDV